MAVAAAASILVPTDRESGWNSFASLDGIECSAAQAVHCVRRFDHDSRVTVHGGRSTWVLPHILYDVPTTFWLDAHYTGDALRPELMDPVDGQCPVLEEIRFIQQFGWSAKPVILIDDLHMYQEPFWSTAQAQNFDRRQWPTLRQLREALLNYQFVPFNGVIYAF